MAKKLAQVNEREKQDYIIRETNVEGRGTNVALERTTSQLGYSDQNTTGGH